MIKQWDIRHQSFKGLVHRKNFDAFILLCKRVRCASPVRLYKVQVIGWSGRDRRGEASSPSGILLYRSGNQRRFRGGCPIGAIVVIVAVGGWLRGADRSRFLEGAARLQQ